MLEDRDTDNMKRKRNTRDKSTTDKCKPNQNKNEKSKKFPKKSES
jgi:hypothetical protein